MRFAAVDDRNADCVRLPAGQTLEGGALGRASRGAGASRVIDAQGARTALAGMMTTGTAARDGASTWSDNTEHAAHDASSCVKWPRWFPVVSTWADRPKPRLSDSGAAVTQPCATRASNAASRHPSRNQRRFSVSILSIRSNRILHRYYAPVPKTLWRRRGSGDSAVSIPIPAAHICPNPLQGGASYPRHAIFDTPR